MAFSELEPVHHASSMSRLPDHDFSLMAAIGNTPLIRINKASAETGCEILGKAEFMNPGGSIKDRIARHIVFEAEKRGIRVTETSLSAADEYLNLITIRAVTAETTDTVSGTVFGKSNTRIVKINNFRLEMIPEGHLALIYNIDRPGSIGQIGTKLGEHDINIGRFQLGRLGDRATCMVNIDTPADESTIQDLKALPHMISVEQVHL